MLSRNRKLSTRGVPASPRQPCHMAQVIVPRGGRDPAQALISFATGPSLAAATGLAHVSWLSPRSEAVEALLDGFE
jgi:hypothetical protein